MPTPCSNGSSAPLARTWPLLIRAVVSLRRSGDDAGGIEEAWRLARRYGELVRMLPVAAAIVERSWLTGTADPRLDECRSVFDGAPVTGLEWARGELASWLRRIDPTFTADGVAEPYRLLFDGQFDAAAATRSTRCRRHTMPRLRWSTPVTSRSPGGRSTCSTGSGPTPSPPRCAPICAPAGETVVPAPRRATTLANPAGLTTRQVEVLRLLEDGLTNAELAERLFLSVKTVDHHVSAILTKLDVTKRRDAVRRAKEVGILG